MPAATLRHRAELVLFLAVRGLVAALPRPAVRPLGAALGQLLWVAGVRRATVRDNLALAFPALSAATRRRIGARCYRHFGAMLCDTIALSRVGPVELCRRLTITGWEHLDAADAAGRGVVVFTGHLGNWEVAARALGLYRSPYDLVVRPFNNPLLYEHMRADRERHGIREVPKRGAARQLFRVIRAGGRVGIAMDQRLRAAQGGIVLPFFGQPALVTPLPARLSLRTGALAVPMFAWPQPGGRYLVEVHEPIAPPPPGEADDAAVAELTGRYLAVLEREIRTHPEQWLWAHRRWRLS